PDVALKQKAELSTLLRPSKRFRAMASEIENCNPLPQLDFSEPPPGSDRRAFMVRSAMAAAIATLTGRPIAAYADTPATSPQSSVKLDPSLDVVKRSKGPVMTLVDEFYKVGPGPSS